MYVCTYKGKQIYNQTANIKCNMPPYTQSLRMQKISVGKKCMTAYNRFQLVMNWVLKQYPKSMPEKGCQRSSGSLRSKLNKKIFPIDVV